jgi:hypothetical protein
MGVIVAMPMGMGVAVAFRYRIRRMVGVDVYAIASGMRMLDRRRRHPRQQHCPGEQQRQPNSQTTLSHKSSDWTIPLWNSRPAVRPREIALHLAYRKPGSFADPDI